MACFIGFSAAHQVMIENAIFHFNNTLWIIEALSLQFWIQQWKLSVQERKQNRIDISCFLNLRTCWKIECSGTAPEPTLARYYFLDLFGSYTPSYICHQILPRVIFHSSFHVLLLFYVLYRTSFSLVWYFFIVDTIISVYEHSRIDYKLLTRTYVHKYYLSLKFFFPFLKLFTVLTLKLIFTNVHYPPKNKLFSMDIDFRSLR